MKEAVSRTLGLKDARELDGADSLSAFRKRFHLPPGVVYLDGNSLGALPVAAARRIQNVTNSEWGDDLIGSWNKNDWIGAPARIGDKVGRLVGARAGEVVVSDSTSVNLFKLIVAAMRERPERRAIVSELGNFPTDLYMIEGAASLTGAELRAVPRDQVLGAIDEDVALVVLTHVHYKSSRMYDMREVTSAAHRKGALILWDLSHSVGAVRVDLNAAGADLAVGCGYKYLNGGPGAPAFLFVAERHLATMHSPLSGWMGHAEPFEFRDHYYPAEGIRRFLCGTPALLSLLALEVGVDIFLEADMEMVERKSRQMTDFFIDLVEQECSGFGLRLASPRLSADRGSHVSFRHDEAHQIMQALIASGVVGDFRHPDVVRFGFTPLYLSFEDVWIAVAAFKKVLADGSWREGELPLPEAVS